MLVVVQFAPTKKQIEPRRTRHITKAHIPSFGYIVQTAQYQNCCPEFHISVSHFPSSGAVAASRAVLQHCLHAGGRFAAGLGRELGVEGADREQPLSTHGSRYATMLGSAVQLPD